MFDKIRNGKVRNCAVRLSNSTSWPVASSVNIHSRSTKHFSMMRSAITDRHRGMIKDFEMTSKIMELSSDFLFWGYSNERTTPMSQQQFKSFRIKYAGRRKGNIIFQISEYSAFYSLFTMYCTIGTHK